MEVVSVNVGIESTVSSGDRRIRSGIIKRAQSGPVRVGLLGLESDVIVHTHVHGGVDQAVYAYRLEDYEWWESRLNRKLEPGLFGENLTLRGMPSADALIGSRLRFREVVLEVTAPRIPCSTFAGRMGDAGFVKTFMRAQRPGFYFRVIETGSISPGESFEIESTGEQGIGTVEVFNASHRRLTEVELRRFLAAPIDERTRADFEARLEKLSDETAQGESWT